MPLSEHEPNLPCLCALAINTLNKRNDPIMHEDKGTFVQRVILRFGVRIFLSHALFCVLECVFFCPTRYFAFWSVYFFVPRVILRFEAWDNTNLALFCVLKRGTIQTTRYFAF